MSKTTDSISSTCVLCCQSIKVYAVGPCDHHICYKCSTKMRVLCDQKYCGVCRTDMPKVIFTQKLHPFQGIISHKFPADRKHGIRFANSKVQEEYRRLQDHRCVVCPSRRLPENTFKDLQDHLRKEHEMFYCELCLEHLQVFTHERKCYNRKNLALHKRKGDPDDTSYRGHPLCEFCDDRYFDNDELLKHLRRQHYFCHFCETDGASNQYYNDYPDLKCHFSEEHYLCEEDDCAGEEFTHAFRSEIDFKAHKAKVHSKGMSKAQFRQARQLDIEVNLPPRQRDNRGLGGSGRGRGRRYNDRYDYNNDYNETARAVQASVDTARREEQTRERDDGAKKAKRGKAAGNDGRRRNGNGSGKTSPVPMEDGGAKVTKTTKDDDNKENQRGRGRQETIPSGKAKPEAAATNVFSKLKKSEDKKVKDFPSLSTFKPLSDETVTPSWIEHQISVSTDTKESKKKKKKKKDGFTIEEPEPPGFVIEEPESEFNLYSGLKNVVEKKPVSGLKNVVEKKPVSGLKNVEEKKLVSRDLPKPVEQTGPKPVEQPLQPMWTLTSSKSSALPVTKVSSTYQPDNSWATKVGPTNVAPPKAAPTNKNQPWGANVATTQPGPPLQHTWANSVAPPKKSKTPTNAAWNNQKSTPDLGNSGDFPTLSSIASLLGGTTTKKSKPANQDSSKNNKQPEREKKAAEKTAMRNKVPEKEKKAEKTATWNKVPEKKAEKTETWNKVPEKEKKAEKSETWNKVPEKEKKAEKTATWNKVAEAENIPKEVVSKMNTVGIGGHGAINSGPRPPPGLSLAPSNNPIKKLPPGFTRVSTLPPGFASVAASSAAPETDYIQPTNYMERNLALLQKIKDFLEYDESKLMIFKTVSGDFRRNNISPAEYYQHCLDLLGATNLPTIFSELVSLLPDVVKQQQLLEAANNHKTQQKQKKQDKVLKISGSKGQSNQKKTSGGKAWGNNAEHSTCTQCGQVMLTVDMEGHLNSHQDFPSLSSSVNSTAKTVMAPPTWGRIK